jgi:hypothetical protein
MENSMPDQYPFIVSNNKIEPILNRIRTAAKPEKLGQELLGTWGFTASNDRAMPRVLKSLGFLTENGAPTSYYDRLRDPLDWKRVLGERIRDVYSDLFAMDPNIHIASESEIKGAISRITGKDEETVKRYYATFRTLSGLADFNPEVGNARNNHKSTNPISEEKSPSPTPEIITPAAPLGHRKSEYHYNIQIHLPVTTDITVYNAIFKSLRENLGV